MNPVPFENLFQFLSSVSIWSVAKIFVLFALLLYIVFAFVVVKQVQMMTDTLCDQFEVPLRVVSVLHLVGAIFVLLLALAVL